MAQFFKSKTFIVLLCAALVAVIVPSVLSAVGAGFAVRDAVNTVLTPVRSFFVWIGDGELRSVLKAPNIEVTGWLNREEAMRKSMSSKIFILTSLWEGLPMSLLESMYMEKICLVNDVIGSRDVIRDGENGYICSSADEFVRVIRNILSDPELLRKVASQARKDIEEVYNTRIMAEKYREIYEEALEQAATEKDRKKKK